MCAALDQNGHQGLADGLGHPPAGPRVELAVGPDDVGRRRNVPATVRDGSPVRPRRDAPLLLAVLKGRGHVPRLGEEAVKHAVARHRLEHLSTELKSPKLPVLLGIGIDALGEVKTRPLVGVVVEHAHRVTKPLNQCVSLQGPRQALARHAHWIRRERAVPVEDVG
eukprot:CAMPEP_0114285686 /NCGR_PEP_ID=MMETSP0059-20121206/5336_1 /TAXON_ID=36894 /ORGANISM="Pyramimonas parkeae, Strain CCMP726" /LENGTH=165 /DNA_ID=CAMNT_0001406635 /DNA_START=1078 /DNA_END=1575 /DNA_ORIENTATION=+